MDNGNFRDHKTKILSSSAIIGLGLNWNIAVQANEEFMSEHKIAGIDISGGITTVLQTTDGAPQNTTALSYSLDLGLEGKVSEHGKAIIVLEAGYEFRIIQAGVGLFQEFSESCGKMEVPVSGLGLPEGCGH